MLEKAIKKRIEMKKQSHKPNDCPNKIPLHFSLDCLLK
jgi:hypothetical protein